MSPASTAMRDQSGYSLLPSPLPHPSADLLRQLSKEIVVDWQMASDPERKN